MKPATCFLVTLFAAGPLAAVPPEELVRKSLENYQRDRVEAIARYTYMERDTERSGGVPKVSTDKELVVNGVPYEVAVSRAGKPLTPEQEAKEREKLEKRRAESPEERAKRLNEYRTSQAFLDEVPEAFDFKLLGEETLDGRSNYVIQCTPKPGYQAHNSRAAMFSHIEAKLWIDKEDLQWSKAEANVLDTISIGWILARIGPGAHMRLHQARLDDKNWLPSLITIDGDARVMLVKDHPIHEEMSFYDFTPVGGGQVASVSSLQSRMETADSARTRR